MERPITIARQEFIEELVSLVNSSGLPAFVISEVLTTTLQATRTQERIQLEEDRKKMEAKKDD